jgi:dipeptidyl aminopeptidase/acylaminoacyl peptidase
VTADVVAIFYAHQGYRSMNETPNARVRRGRRLVPLALGALAILVVARIAGKSYLWALVDFEAGPVADISRHPADTGIAGLTEVSFPARDGTRIAGWYVPSKNGAAIVVTHGTNADRAWMLPETRILAGGNFGVLAFDWPGNGASQGSVHWGRGERAALVGAVDWLVSRSDVDSHRIGGLGFSMGGYMMAQVAAAEPRLRAVVLEATPTAFDEYERWTHKRWGLLSGWPAIQAARRSGMPVDEMHPKDVVAMIAPRPLLIIGGQVDPIVPPQMIQALFDAAHEPKTLWMVPGAEHGGYASAAPDEYRDRLLTYFSSTLLN